MLGVLSAKRNGGLGSIGVNHYTAVNILLLRSTMAAYAIGKAAAAGVFG